MSGMQSRLVRANLLGTGVFVVASGVAMPFKADRWAQVLVIVVSVALFAVGIFTSLQAYARALDRSRVHEIGVANLYLLTGRTAPPPVKRSMLLALGVQVVVAVVAASVGVSGLGENDLNALAFAVLTPMFGIGMNGAWAARYGSFGPRLNPTTKPSHRRIE